MCVPDLAGGFCFCFCLFMQRTLFSLKLSETEIDLPHDRFGRTRWVPLSPDQFWYDLCIKGFFGGGGGFVFLSSSLAWYVLFLTCCVDAFYFPFQTNLFSFFPWTRRSFCAGDYLHEERIHAMCGTVPLGWLSGRGCCFSRPCYVHSWSTLVLLPLSSLHALESMRSRRGRLLLSFSPLDLKASSERYLGSRARACPRLASGDLAGLLSTLGGLPAQP